MIIMSSVKATKSWKRDMEAEIAHEGSACIDLRLTVSEGSSGDTASRTSRVSATSDSVGLQTPSHASASTSGSELNDFDVIFKEIQEEAVPAGISPLARSLLTAWRFHNSGRIPCKRHLKCFEGLTKTPGAALVKWLNEHPATSTGSSAFVHAPPSRRVKRSDVGHPYKARCLEKSQKSESSEPGIYPCTSRCGKTFSTKASWERHEKSNFEVWQCDLCTTSEIRKSRLQTHLKEQHSSESKVSSQHKREFFSSTQRPCGICLQVYNSWSVWLTHVADHFKNILPGGGKSMSDWVEVGNAQICNVTGGPPVAIQDGTADADVAASYSWVHDPNDQLPPVELGGLSSRSGYDYPSPSLDLLRKEAHCGQCKLTGSLTIQALKLFTPPSGAAIFTTRIPRKSDDIAALSPAMAAMVVSKIRNSCRRYTTAQSDISCCCNECERQLNLRTPGVPSTPGNMVLDVAEPDDARLVMLQEFLTGTNDPWTSFNTRRR